MLQRVTKGQREHNCRGKYAQYQAEDLKRLKNLPRYNVQHTVTKNVNLNVYCLVYLQVCVTGKQEPDIAASAQVSCASQPALPTLAAEPPTTAINVVASE